MSQSTYEFGKGEKYPRTTFHLFVIFWKEEVHSSHIYATTMSFVIYIAEVMCGRELEDWSSDTLYTSLRREAKRYPEVHFGTSSMLSVKFHLDLYTAGERHRKSE